MDLALNARWTTTGDRDPWPYATLGALHPTLSLPNSIRGFGWRHRRRRGGHTKRQADSASPTTTAGEQARSTTTT